MAEKGEVTICKGVGISLMAGTSRKEIAGESKPVEKCPVSLLVYRVSS